MSYTNNPQDENAIRDLVARYNDAVNRIDQEAWADTWCEDGSWELMGTRISGKGNIVPFWATAMASFKFALMMLNSGTLDIDSDSATGRWYITEHTRAADGTAATIVGVYDDCYRKENGSWLFLERRYHILYHGGADLSGDYQAYPD